MNVPFAKGSSFRYIAIPVTKRRTVNVVFTFECAPPVGVVTALNIFFIQIFFSLARKYATVWLYVKSNIFTYSVPFLASIQYFTIRILTITATVFFWNITELCTYNFMHDTYRQKVKYYHKEYSIQRKLNFTRILLKSANRIFKRTLRSVHV